MATNYRNVVEEIVAKVIDEIDKKLGDVVIPDDYPSDFSASEAVALQYQSLYLSEIYPGLGRYIMSSIEYFAEELPDLYKTAADYFGYDNEDDVNINEFYSEIMNAVKQEFNHIYTNSDTINKYLDGYYEVDDDDDYAEDEDANANTSDETEILNL